MPAQKKPRPASAPAFTPPLTWAYPFPGKDRKEITDPQIFYVTSSFLDDGFFPLGVNGFPHGGIHFGTGGDDRLYLAGGVCSLTEGEIIAYRLNGAYLRLQFTDGKWAAYSTGFVLVRHRLTMPPAPEHTGAQPADEMHEIYSLYMHLADWSLYHDDPTLPRPFWWDVDAYRVSGKDHQRPAPEGGAAGAAGAFVWTAPAAGKKGQYSAGAQVGFLPEGSEVIIGEKRGEWGHIQSITEGGMISPSNGGDFGREDLKVPWLAPDGDTTGRTPVTPADDWGWLHLPSLQPTKEPRRCDEVVIPDPPLPVKAGTLLGQIGEYQDYERATLLPPTSRRRRLHLEVFADDGFSAFLAKSRARAAQLPAEQKTLLVIDAGAKLVHDVPRADRKLGDRRPVSRVELAPDSPSTGVWVKVQPRCRDSATGLHVSNGPPVWIERANLAQPVDGTPAWSQFPLKLQDAAAPANAFALTHARAELDALEAAGQAIDEHGVRWWRVWFRATNGKSLFGWVCGASHPGTKWESPWAWPGFETVDATGIDLVDAFRRNLVITGSAEGAEAKTFEPAVLAVNRSPLLQKLDQTVTRAEAPGQDGKVTAVAMQAALRVPALAHALSRVILRYESEWGGNMARWQAITPAMRNGGANWVKELGRIEKLQWWNEVKGKVAGFPQSATVLHVHPIALVANFAGSLDYNEFIHLAKTIFGEARGQNFQSKLSVAWIIRNRVERGRATYSSVVTARYQFTCWDAHIDPINFNAIQNPSGPAWEESKRAAREVMNSPSSANLLPGATNYYSPAAQAQLHAQNPLIYPAIPPFASASKLVSNPPGVSEHDYKFYRP